MAVEKMGQDLIEALDQLEKEKDISKDVLLETLENSLLAACKAQYNKADNIRVEIDRITGKVAVYADRTVVEQVEDVASEISIVDARKLNSVYELGDLAPVEVTPRNFGRIAAQKAKQVVLQKIREEERKSLFSQYYHKEKDIVTGVIQRYIGKNISVNLGKVDATLSDTEQIETEVYKPNERIKVYVLEVKDTTKGPRIYVSRTHPELVKRLFEFEVAEIQDGNVEIKSIAREAGSRTKMAVYSKNQDIDAIGACVGFNRQRIDAILDELKGEKIDIVLWDEDPVTFIKNALSPSKVVSVTIGADNKSARVVVPDFQLSLAIGKEGQNARLAAKLTGYKIDIKSESQAKEIEAEEAALFAEKQAQEAERLAAIQLEAEKQEAIKEAEAKKAAAKQKPAKEVKAKAAPKAVEKEAVEEVKEVKQTKKKSKKKLDIHELDRLDEMLSKQKVEKEETSDFFDFTAMESSSPAKKKKNKKK